MEPVNAVGVCPQQSFLCDSQEYVTHVDPMSQLGLTSDSVEGYNIGEIHRPSSPSAALTPELLPCGYLVGDSNTINIQLKGASSWKTASVKLIQCCYSSKQLVQHRYRKSGKLVAFNW